MRPEKKLVEEMKNAKDKEEALKILGEYMASRLNELGEDYSKVAGSLVGSLIATTELMMYGRIASESYESIGDASIEAYMETVNGQRKKLKSEVNRLFGSILEQLPSLKNLPDVKKELKKPIYT